MYHFCATGPNFRKSYNRIECHGADFGPVWILCVYILYFLQHSINHRYLLSMKKLTKNKFISCNLIIKYRYETWLLSTELLFYQYRIKSYYICKYISVLTSGKKKISLVWFLDIKCNIWVILKKVNDVITTRTRYSTVSKMAAVWYRPTGIGNIYMNQVNFRITYNQQKIITNEK